MTLIESKHMDSEIEVGPSLDRFSGIRWTVWGNVYPKKSNYNPLMKLWDVLVTAGKLESDFKARIIGAQNQMSQFNFF